MEPQFERTALLLGEEALSKLNNSRVAVFGVGGVGGYVVEALARSGIGALDLIDNDTVSESNLNRQLLATRSTVGKNKVEVAAARVKDINPYCKVTPLQLFYLPETADQFDFTQYDYIVDAIDTVKGKLQLIAQAKVCNTPIISSMGTGNKLDPGALRITYIEQTDVDPLARVMRKELKKRHISKVKCVCSTEPPVVPAVSSEPCPEGRRSIPGSTAFVPATAGLMIAAEVVRDLTGVTDGSLKPNRKGID